MISGFEDLGRGVKNTGRGIAVGAIGGAITGIHACVCVSVCVCVCVCVCMHVCVYIYEGGAIRGGHTGSRL